MPCCSFVHHLQGARRRSGCFGQVGKFSINEKNFNFFSLRRMGGKVTKCFELVKDNCAEKDFAAVEESSVDLTCTCCSAAALLTQPIILMPNN